MLLLLLLPGAVLATFWSSSYLLRYIYISYMRLLIIIMELTECLDGQSSEHAFSFITGTENTSILFNLSSHETQNTYDQGRLAAEMIWWSLLLPPSTTILWVLLITSGMLSMRKLYLNIWTALLVGNIDLVNCHELNPWTSDTSKVADREQLSASNVLVFLS